MAIYQIQYRSTALMKNVGLVVIYLDDTPKETKSDNPVYDRAPHALMLLHGFADGFTGLHQWLSGS